MKYVVEVNNQEQADAVYSFNNKKEREHHSYPIVVASNGMYGNDIEFHKQPEIIAEYGPILSFKTFSQMFNIQLKPNKPMKLTDEYNAVVNYTEEVVQVGCQVVPFSKVEELYKLINQ